MSPFICGKHEHETERLFEAGKLNTGQKEKKEKKVSLAKPQFTDQCPMVNLRS